jgi:hypothetical protein
MLVKNFKYQKKKDNEIKNYLVMILEEDEKHYEGLDLTKLEDKEIEDAKNLVVQFEMKDAKWRREANNNGQDIKNYIEENEDIQKEIDEYKENLKPYVKKAYRKYLKENIVEDENNFNTEEQLLNVE